MTDADAEMIAEKVDNRPCEDCGCQMLAWFAPNMIWNRVIGGPDAQYDPGGVLCPSCFIKRAEIAGIIEVWKLAPASDEDHAQAQEVSRARAEAERLREALERIAGFAPGYGEIAEQIAQMARHALDPELAAMHEAWRDALTQEQRDD